MTADATRKVYTVSELTRLIKAALERQFGTVWIEGELSNVRQPSSGHYYLTIKDESAQISGVLFRGAQRGMTFRPRDGLLVRVFGEISVYERSGSYQIVIRRMEEGGKGQLQARFEALKDKLLKEGLFAPERKRPLPMLPRHIGVVTSPTGAAIRDILNVISRRFPNLHMVLAPVKVQGEGAAEEIAAAIERLNGLGGLDVLIVGRGGGSLEDLWCFNEEIVARAIAASRLPVISAVGHEIDFTISDFVADLRAPTPSAAAELVVGRKEDFDARLGELTRRLLRSIQDGLVAMRHRLRDAAGSYVFREPANMVKQLSQRLDGLELRVAHEMRGALREGRQRLGEWQATALHLTRMQQQASGQELRRLETHLNALSPLAVLGRGYSITSGRDGRVIRTADEVRSGQRLITRVARGSFESEVVVAEGGGGDDGQEG